MSNYKWPYKGDSPNVKSRKVALVYREHLKAVNPRLAERIDEAMKSFGQSWVLKNAAQRDSQDWVLAREAAELLGVTVGAIRQARSRGKLQGEEFRPGLWRYKVEEIMSLHKSDENLDFRGLM